MMTPTGEFTIVSLVGVEAKRESMDVTRSVCASSGTCNGRESEEDRGLLSGRVEERGSGNVGPVAVRLKVSMGGGSSCMNYLGRNKSES